MVTSQRERRVAIVTGGAQGIGRSAALRLAHDGFAVAVLDIDRTALSIVKQELLTSGVPALAVELDVRDPKATADAISHVQSELGNPHALVNCAGVLVVHPTLDLAIDDWRRVIETNLTGYFICAQAVARRFAANARGGRIVNVASVHSESPSAGLAAYDASKGGIWMLTKSLALEFAPLGVTVNAIGPGLIVNTALAGPANDAYLTATVPHIPLGRAGVPEDVAGPIAFLCSDDARYITGTMLYVDGGMLLTAHT